MSPRCRTTLWRDRKAVGTLEFAIIATALFMLVFGAIEFARLMWAKQALELTAIQGARCIGVLASGCSSAGAYSETNTRNYIQTAASTWGITLTAANIAPSYTAASGACTGLSEVSLSYTFQSAVPGLLTMLAGGKALSSHACFPKQS